MTIAQDSNSTPPQSLYERLGGVEGVTLIVDDVIEAHMNNPEIKEIFIPYKEQPERLASIRQHTIDFFSAGSGGPVEYKGRDMPTTHEGMNISALQYMCVMDDILGVLNEHEIDEESKKDVLFILWSLKGVIMNK
ncbi:MAG: group 1 truncated hemoglobin [Bacteroidetes bacterium]|nr:group 1 truncated hemoglobin [Bacteroidota bacterium]